MDTPLSNSHDIVEFTDRSFGLTIFNDRSAENCEHEWGDPEECPNECGDDHCMVPCRLCNEVDIACEG
jgi:hypothetical protein